MRVVRESYRLGAAKETPQDYNNLFRSEKVGGGSKHADRPERLVGQMREGRRAQSVSEEAGVIRRLRAEYCKA